MKRLLPWFSSLSLFLLCLLLPTPSLAESSHARIIRLSLVQGDVRFAREFHKDSLDDSKANWEIAPLNLPIRQGYALATDTNGRAEVEFENGAMAFLSPNTLIEFYDLSRDDGALVTRLVLRQGSAIFYVNPAKTDFFSVTGGDFSVEANGRTRFRLDNYDDGSTLNVEQGHVDLLRNNETKHLEQGQSYSINVNDAAHPVTARLADYDEFDKWVSGRIDSVVTATNYATNYANSPDYTSGLADLYNYGNWYDVPGYGFGWQPYGMGLGWSPFDYGAWNFDPFFGWNFIGSQAWGWLPYHYGGWLFSPVYGWLWTPMGFGFGGPMYYSPVTAVWVHSGSTTGLVPLHPADVHGKAPLNLARGVYPVQGNTIAATPIAGAGEKWAVMNHPPRETLTATALASAPSPTRVSRTILSGNSGSRSVTLSRDSSIAYDPAEHRFVNNNEPAKTSLEAERKENGKVENVPSRGKEAAVPTVANRTEVPSVPRTVVSRPSIAPPAPPASTHSASSSHSWGGPAMGGPGYAGMAGSVGSTTTSAAGSSHSSGGSGHH